MDTTLRTSISIFLVVLSFLVMGLGMTVDGIIRPDEFSLAHIPANIARFKAATPRLFVVESGSMEPGIKTASIVMVRPQAFYLPGDVITFSPNASKDSFVTHRITQKSVTETGGVVYTTKGDANENIDVWEVADGQILGKVNTTIPYLGYAVDFAKTPKGFIALIIIPATIIVYEELKFIFSQARSALKRKPRKSSSVTSSQVSKASILVPVLGAGIVFIATTSAFYSDREESTVNTISASETYQPTLVLNEFLAVPVVESTEWIEIYNPTENEINLTDWALETSTSTVSLTSLGSVSGHSYVVLEMTNALSDTGDSIKLISPTDTVIDGHTYVSAPGDQSLGRQTDGNLPFKDCTSPTKGVTNNGSC